MPNRTIIKPGDKLLLPPVARERTGVGKSQEYVLRKKGQFPRPVKIGKRGIAYLESEIEQWIADKVAQRDNAQPDLLASGAERGHQ